MADLSNKLSCQTKKTLLFFFMGYFFMLTLLYKKIIKNGKKLKKQKSGFVCAYDRILNKNVCAFLTKTNIKKKKIYMFQKYQK